MSQLAPCGRETPRWSNDGQSLPLTPFTAALPGLGRCVRVGPPLFASTFNCAGTPFRLPTPASAQVPSLDRLYFDAVNVLPLQLPPTGLSEMMVFLRKKKFFASLALYVPPPAVALFCSSVTLVSVTTEKLEKPASLLIPPPVMAVF